MKAWRVKGKIVGKFLSYSVSRGYICLCMLLSAGFLAFLNWLVPIAIWESGGAWFGLTILFIVLPHIVFRGIFRYWDVPQGWLPGTYKAWQERHAGVGFQGVKGNGLNINWKLVGRSIGLLVCCIGGLLGILILIEVFSGEYMPYVIVGFIVLSVITPYLYLRIFRPNLLENNGIVRARNKRNAGVIGKMIQHGNGVNFNKGHTMKYSNFSFGSGGSPNNFGHWNSYRFDPVGDQRRLRGEGL